MTPAFSTRRRAERFHEELRRAAGPARAGSSTTMAPVEDRWLDLVVRLREVPEVAPRPEFVAALRTRLLEAGAALQHSGAEHDPADDRARRLQLAPRRPVPERRVVAGVAALALVGAGATMAVAAQGSLPGESLYPLKRGIESVHVALQRDPSSKGRTLLGDATTRLDEAGELVGSDADTALVTTTLADFVDEATQGSGLLTASPAEPTVQADVLAVRAFTATSLSDLGQLAGQAPAVLRPSLGEVSAAVVDLDEAARRVCPSCGTPLPATTLLAALDPTGASASRRLEGPVDQQASGSARDDPGAPRKGTGQSQRRSPGASSRPGRSPQQPDRAARGDRRAPRRLDLPGGVPDVSRALRQLRDQLDALVPGAELAPDGAPGGPGTGLPDAGLPDGVAGDTPRERGSGPGTSPRTGRHGAGTVEDLGAALRDLTDGLLPEG